MSVSSSSIPDRTREDLRRVFDEIDTDRSGYISGTELKDSFAKLGIHSSGQAIRDLISSVDQNSDGKVSFDEFREAFQRLALRNKSGRISLARVAQEWQLLAAVDTGTDLGVVVPPSAGGGSSSSSLPLSQFLLAGGIGGVCSRTLTAPLERLKLQAQVSGQGVRFTSIPAAIKQLAVADAFSGLMAGNTANCVRVFPFAGLSCVLYSQFVEILPCDDEMDAMEGAWRFVAGAGAGCGASMLTYPLDVVKARMTVGNLATSSRSNSHMNKDPRLGSSFVGVLRQLQQEGALYRGMGTTLAAVVPFVGLHQSINDVLRMSFIDGHTVPHSAFSHALCGGIAGAIAQTVVYPLDVLRRRLQVLSINSNCGAQKAESSVIERSSIQKSLRTVLQKEGVRALFAGLGPTYLKVVPAVAISITCRDWVLGRF